MQDSDRALVPLGSGLAAPPPVPGGRIDMPRLLAAAMFGPDPNQVAARVDLDAIVERVDVDAVAARIDVDAITRRIDVDAVVGRVDLDAVVARIDVPGLIEQVIDEVDLGEIIRESSSTTASETVDALRVQGMRVDGLVSRIVDRILLRDGQRQTDPLHGQGQP